MLKLTCRGLLVAFGLYFIAGCSDGGDNHVSDVSSDVSDPVPEVEVEVEPGPYADDALWLCKPGISGDLCLDLDQTITYVYEDGNMAVFEHEPAVDAPFDCFYVYPTVDMRAEPGNTLDLSDVSLMQRPLNNQAARFTSVCNVFAPKYRQMTIGTYGVEAPFESEYFQLGYQDVEQAFDQYLLENPDRNFVLMGHSQGSHVLIELLLNRFENDEVLRSRMISALVVGAVGRLEVPAGELSGGTFDNIPLCSHATDTGCIVAYDSIAAGAEADRTAASPPLPCVDPTRLGGEPGIAGNTIYANDEGIPFPEGVDTYWIGYPGLYATACETDGFLGVSVAPGRSTLYTPQLIQDFLGGSTLHQVDYSFAMADLLRIVETQASHH